MNPVLQSLLSELARVFAREVAEYLTNDNKTSNKASDSREKMAHIQTVATFPPENLRDECRAIINRFAPTHGPELRIAFAAVGARKLGEVGDDQLAALYSELAKIAEANADA